MKMLKDSVLKSREGVDCMTLKDIEQKRCEIVGKSLIQMRNSLEEDLEFAKSHLPVLARDANQVCGLSMLSTYHLCHLFISRDSANLGLQRTTRLTTSTGFCRQGITPMWFAARGPWMM
jgi:hypothetical protein